MVAIDGSYGEGGGQVLRTSLSLSALLGLPLSIENIRAGRPNPGLQAQHLTAVQAMARVCQAHLKGARLGSQTLTFIPTRPARPGRYSFDVAQARKGGSAGAVSLLLQTLLLPLAMAEGSSDLLLKGGTNVAWSPPFQYLKHIYLPMLRRMGLEAEAQLERCGWYPRGGGAVQAQLKGWEGHWRGLKLLQRGKLVRLWGLSASSNLPRHIRIRQKRRAEELLAREGFDPEIETLEAPSPGPGTMVFLVAESEGALAGFTALGRRRKPAEEVASEAVDAFLRYYQSGAALEEHLADQLALPMALAKGPSAFSTCQLTQHLLTNIWVIGQFIKAELKVRGEKGEPGQVHIEGVGWPDV